MLGASKQVEQGRVLEAIALGIEHVGENWIQEAESKFSHPEMLHRPMTLHLIGHLQTNKIRRALGLFNVIQTVDSLRLAQRINSVANELNQQVPIYIEVNIGLEPGKNGVKPDQLMDVAKLVAQCERLELKGLMAVPPFFEDPEEVRPYFKMLRELRDTLQDLEPFHDRPLKLSMGMSHDFDVAVEEGATMVRLGSSIWGLDQPNKVRFP